jgi:tRNA threonylcarbamoyladenosine biosynthesis protein TsaE
MELIVKTTEDMPAAVKALLDFAEGRKKIALYGELGAGKTTFVQAFCRHFGVREYVTSPTFTLVNEYTWVNGNGQEQTIHHLDLYRLKNIQEAYGIGIEDYLYDECYCLIEWPELAESILPEDTVHIKISLAQQSSRKILFL